MFEAAGRLAPGGERAAIIQRLSDHLAADCAVSPGLVRNSLYLFRDGVTVRPDNGPVNGVVLRFLDYRP